MRKDELYNESVETIYFGGGTPSLLSTNELQRIFDAIYKHYKVVDIPEITLEANPDDLTPKQINNLSSSPINRLSIGVQSFFEDDLKIMNRAHNANEAKQCLELTRAHFDNISIDLIYGIPNMSLEKWKENLHIAFDFNAPHISSYALTIEPKTALDTFIKKGIYPPVDDDLAFQHFNILREETKAAGFIQYEVSNFGKPDYFSKHNMSYWQKKSYLGIGPSAHSYYRNQRSWNVANNSKYIKAIAKGELPREVEVLTKKDQFNEYIMTGLRTIWGVSINTIELDFGLDYKTHLLEASEVFKNQRLLEHDDSNCLKITKSGQFLADGIASELFILN